MKITKFIARSPIVPTLICSRRFESNIQKSGGRENMSVWEGLILASLFFEDRSCRPSEIAKVLQMSRSQMSQTIKRLESSGFIQRQLSPTSARSVDLSLTTKGRRQATKAIKAFDHLSQTIDRILDSSTSELIAKGLLSVAEH